MECRFKYRMLLTWLMAGLLTASPLMAQDSLSDDVSALDELPEDDVAGGDKSQALEDLPTESPSAPAQSSAADAPPDDFPAEDSVADAPSDDLNAGDLADDTAPSDELAGPEKKESLESEVDALENETADINELPSAGESLTGAAQEPTGRMTGLDFQQLPDRVRLKISADRPLNWTRELRSSRRQVIVEMRNMEIARNILRRALDTGEFDGPVALVQAFPSKSGAAPSVKVLFQLRNFVDPAVLASGNDLYVDFPIVSDGTLFRTAGAEQAKLPKTVLSVNDMPAFAGQKISLNVKEAELADVINLLAKVSGKNFVLADGAKTKVTLNVRNTPWDQVLAMILFNNKLGYQEIGNTYRVVLADTLRAEIKAAQQTIEDQLKLIPLETRLFPLSYASTQDVESKLQTFLTKDRGKIVSDNRTNTITVTDVPESLERISRYIKAIDKQTSLVLIEARIVEASQDLSHDLGIQWSLGDIDGDPFTGSFVNLGNAQSGAAFNPTTGQQGGLGLKIGGLGFMGSITAALRLLERERKAKVIASPRVVVIDKQQASLTNGSDRPIQSSTTSGGATTTSTSFTTAKLELKVTPQVSSDGFVFLNVDLTREVPHSADTGKESRNVKTQLLVESGKTSVLGGVYLLDEDETEQGWPGLRSIPILGALFTGSKTYSKSSSELLMFISPKILNAEKAFLANVDAGLDSGAGYNKATAGNSFGNDESIPDDLF